MQSEPTFSVQVKSSWLFYVTSKPSLTHVVLDEKDDGVLCLRGSAGQAELPERMLASSFDNQPSRRYPQLASHVIEAFEIRECRFGPSKYANVDSVRGFEGLVAWQAWRICTATNQSDYYRM